MNRKKHLTIRSRMNSFSYAIAGLKQLIRQEPNVRLHALATIAAIVAGVIKGLAGWQWAALIIVIGLVWIVEAVNTAIEMLCDHVCGGQIHPAIKAIKDIAAAAVLVAAFISVITGLIIFTH